MVFVFVYVSKNDTWLVDAGVFNGEISCLSCCLNIEVDPTPGTRVLTHPFRKGTAYLVVG